jgi:urocanate hydratase
MKDNIKWIEGAQENNLVVGSQARILYADSEGRIAIAKAFNKAIEKGLISAPIVLGRDHHDVSGTDSPLEKLLIYTMVLHLLQIWLSKMLLEIHLEELPG